MYGVGLDCHDIPSVLHTIRGQAAKPPSAEAAIWAQCSSSCDIITSANFGDELLRGSHVARGQIFGFPIDMCYCTVQVCDLTCVICNFFSSFGTSWLLLTELHN